MKKIIRQAGKVILLFALGFIVSYPYNILLCQYAESPYFWPMMLSVLLAATGVLVSAGIHHKRMRFSVEVIKQKISPVFFKEFGIQFLTVAALFVLVVIKEANQKFYSPAAYCSFLEQMLDSHEQAVYLSYKTMPVLATGYLVPVSFLWIFYNLARILFDEDMHLKQS